MHNLLREFNIYISWIQWTQDIKINSKFARIDKLIPQYKFRLNEIPITEDSPLNARYSQICNLTIQNFANLQPPQEFDLLSSRVFFFFFHSQFSAISRSLTRVDRFSDDGPGHPRDLRIGRRWFEHDQASPSIRAGRSGRGREDKGGFTVACHAASNTRVASPLALPCHGGRQAP